ncbi:MAG: hypothetical protein ACJ79E_02655 [Anaeromyxobacteraceae bacterium]
MTNRSMLAAICAILATGCGSSTKLSLSARASGTAAAAAATALSAGPGVDVTRVRIVVDRLRFESSASSDAGAPSGDADEVIAGPYLIDLSGAALAGGLTQVFDVEARAGTYRDLRFRVHKLDGSEAQFAGMTGLSIAVDGTVSGAAFAFTSALDEEQRRDATFAVASDRSNNVTLRIDPAAWFAGDGGALLDPRDAANRSRIEANIKSSIDAFDDDDRDGERDLR